MSALPPALLLGGDAPVRLCPSPGRGLGLFTTRSLVAGSPLLRERPLLTFPSVWQAVFRWEKGELTH